MREVFWLAKELLVSHEKFYISLTVHLGTILANNQLDALL